MQLFVKAHRVKILNSPCAIHAPQLICLPLILQHRSPEELRDPYYPILIQHVFCGERTPPSFKR